jgi:WD40 repeat protein
VLARLPAPGQTLTYTPDGQYLFCGYYNTGELSIWSVPSGRLVAEVHSDGVHTGTTWSCAISPNGQLLAAIGSGLRVWDLPRLLQPSESAGSTSQPFISTTNGASGLFFDASGKSLLYQVSRNESQAEIYRQSVESTAQPSLIATNVESNYAQSQCLLPKRGEVAYVTRDREITILDFATSKVLRSFPTRQPGDDSGWFIANLRASPDETRFAVVTPSGLGVEIRDVITGEVLYALPEETAAIWWLAWHPDSQHLAITRANGEIAIWNLREIDTQLASLGLKP